MVTVCLTASRMASIAAASPSANATSARAELTSPVIHELLTRSVAPLPIALISTVGEDGVYNAAPYSLTVPISYKPPLVLVSFGFRKGQKKDTVKNLEYTGDFVINILDDSLIQKTLQTI